MATPVQRAREYIDRFYPRALRVCDLAARYDLSQFHFIRAFRAEVGQTPHQYLRSRRIERAKELLVTTPTPIIEICAQVGFKSVGSFTTVFGRLTGETPGAYRAARRKDVYIPSCFIRMYRADK